MWFIEIDNDNRPIGFYPSSHLSIPNGAIEVDDETKDRIYDSIDTITVVNGVEIKVNKRTIKEPPEIKRRRSRRRDIEADNTLQRIKTMTPNQAYSMVKGSTPTEFKEIVASLAKYIAYEYDEDN